MKELTRCYSLTPAPLSYDIHVQLKTIIFFYENFRNSNDESHWAALH
jgi:hypothetical protein